MNKTWCETEKELNAVRDQISILGKISSSDCYQLVPKLPDPPFGVYWSEEKGYAGYDYRLAYDMSDAKEVSLTTIAKFQRGKCAELSMICDEPFFSDPVNHPSHYTGGKVECIDAMTKFLGSDAVAHFCLCNVFKYLWRHADKNGEEDVQKALWYFDKYKEIVNR